MADLKIWCETCEGTGTIHEESQLGVAGTGGDRQCPDCKGEGYHLRTTVLPFETQGEPVAWRVRRHDAPGYWIAFLHKPVDAMQDPEREVQALYTRPAAQPVQVPEGWAAGIKAAARLLDRKADEYANEFGAVDPDTGTFEFKREVQREYHSTLVELADEVRAMLAATPLPPAQPEPVNRRLLDRYAINALAGQWAHSRVEIARDGNGFPVTGWAFSDVRLGHFIAAIDEAEAQAAQPVGREALSDNERAELERLRALVNTPTLHSFRDGVVLEAAHQRERWGSTHDAGKQPADWFWLVGHLAGKALHAQVAGNAEKALHHTISTAAALANWHASITGEHTEMRPGIDQAAHGITEGGQVTEALPMVRGPLTDIQWLKKWTGKTGQRIRNREDRAYLLGILRFAEKSLGIGGEGV